MIVCIFEHVQWRWARNDRLARGLQADDHRGVQEPLNETMCGCNDIGAQPGKMGAFGHEGDGGCACQGLTVRGSAYLVLDTVASAHATRRQLIETLNFPPTLAFTKGQPAAAAAAAAAAASATATTIDESDLAIKTPSMSFIASQLPPNVKLQTITSNYKNWNGQRLILRFAHMYQVGCLWYIHSSILSSADTKGTYSSYLALRP